MAGKTITSPRVPWVFGIIRKVHETSYAIDLACVRCGERVPRRYCCFDKAVNLGLETFASMHFACTEKRKKETVL